MTPDVEEARLARAMSEMAPVVDRYDLDAAPEGAGREIWHRAVADVRAGNLDDRPLYWTRLRLRRALAQRGAPTALFEQLSRGFDLAGPPRQPTVLVAGFDPFHLDRDIRQCNPSGVVALALDGTEVSGTRVRSAILPVRFRDFDDGVVERLMTPLFAGGLVLAVTLSMGREAFDLERFPGRRRSADRPDNVNAYGGGSIGTPRVPPGLAGPEFLEFSLPARAMQAVGGRWSIRDNRRVHTLCRGEFVAASLPELASETAVRGSGGGYLSNEVAYRSLLLHGRLGADFPIGHIHTPALRGHDAATVGDIVAQVRGMIMAALGG